MGQCLACRIPGNYVEFASILFERRDKRAPFASICEAQQVFLKVKTVTRKRS